MFTDFKNPFTVGLCNKFSERYLLLVVGPMPKTHHAGNFGRCLLGAVDSILASHGRDRQTDRSTNRNRQELPLYRRKFRKES